MSLYGANKSRAVLSRVLKQAVRDGIISRNACEATQSLKIEARKDVTWSNDEVLLFLSVARTHRLYAAFYLALATGMRRGEVLGLRWKDGEGETLTVAQNLVKVKNYSIITSPKTERSKRRVTLDPETVATLEEHRLAQKGEAKNLGENWRDDKHLGLVFTSEFGTKCDLNNFQRTWYTLQERTRTAYINSGRSE